MKNYIIGTLIVALMVLSSIIYKNGSTPGNKFPVPEVSKSNKTDFPMHIYVFFSKTDCFNCLEFIDVLNQLPPHFAVIGLVPEDELKDETALRAKTGAQFPLLSDAKFRKFFPSYKPSIVGVSPSTKEVVFTLPGVPGEKAYLETFLDSLYAKLYPTFYSKSISKGTHLARRLKQ